MKGELLSSWSYSSGGWNETKHRSSPYIFQVVACVPVNPKLFYYWHHAPTLATDRFMIRIYLFILVFIYVLFLSADILLKCPSCHGHYSGSHCKNCKRFAFQCIICRIAVKGILNLYPLIRFWCNNMRKHARL